MSAIEELMISISDNIPNQEQASKEDLTMPRWLEVALSWQDFIGQRAWFRGTTL